MTLHIILTCMHQTFVSLQYSHAANITYFNTFYSHHNATDVMTLQLLCMGGRDCHAASPMSIWQSAAAVNVHFSALEVGSGSLAPQAIDHVAVSRHCKGSEHLSAASTGRLR